MLPLALLVAASLLLTWAIRGRVTARGRFCRKCRFDLAGLPSPETCPECGRDLTQPKAAKPTLRRVRRLPLAGAVVLLLLGASLTTIFATNNTARIWAAMPDRVILALHALGIDAAFTEIAANRLSGPAALPDSAWPSLITAALAHQADADTPWDPRHGEVLQHSFTASRLTPDQITAYFTHGTESSVDFPAAIRHGAPEIGVRIMLRPSFRIASLKGSNGLLYDGTDTVWAYLSAESMTLGTQCVTPPGSNTGYTGFSIPGPGGGGQGSMGFTAPLANLNWHAIPPDADLPVTVHYETGIHRMSGRHTHQGGPTSITRNVRILPPETELVALNTDPAAVSHYTAHSTIRITPLHIVPPDSRSGNHIAEFTIIAVENPYPISGRLVALHDGREYLIAHITCNRYAGHSLQSQSWTTTDPPDDSVINAWIAAGQVTLEIRPDPRHAEKTPGITAILGVPLRFEGVRVTTNPNPASESSLPNPDHTTARPVATLPTPQPSEAD